MRSLRPSHRLARLAALPARERRVLASAAARLPIAWIALRVAGLARLQAWERRAFRRGSQAGADALPEARTIAAIVEIAARHSPFPNTCLSRSITLAWMLRRRGIASELRIGVRRTGASLEAHAWVECAGVPVNDTPESIAGFDPLQPPPQASA